MDIFGIIYKALEGLKKSIDGLLKNMDKALKKQDALLFADGSNVTNYRDLQLDILKNVSFEGTTLFMAKPDSIWQFMYGYYDSVSPAGSELLKSEEYLIKYKDKPIQDFCYITYDPINPEDLLAVLSLDCAKDMNFEYLFSGYTNLREVRNIKRVEGASSIKRMFSGCKNLVHIDDFVTNDLTDISFTFDNCKKLKKLPKIDTSKVTNFSYTLYYGGVEFIPDSWSFDSAKNLDCFAYGSELVEVYLSAPLVETIEFAFQRCEKLKEAHIQLNEEEHSLTSVHAHRMFTDCSSLEEVYFSSNKNVNQIDDLFRGCSNLKTITWDFGTPAMMDTAFLGCYNLETFNGTTGLGSTMNFMDCSKLSYDSLISIINRLRERSGGEELILHQEAYDRLTPEDIAVATNKGWSVISANEY